MTSGRRADMWRPSKMSTLHRLLSHEASLLQNCLRIAIIYLTRHLIPNPPSVIKALRSFVVRSAEKEHGAAESCHCLFSRMIPENVNRRSLSYCRREHEYQLSLVVETRDVFSSVTIDNCLVRAVPTAQLYQSTRPANYVGIQAQ